jgi:serine/threonine protein phosphatase PrpC
MGLIPRSHGRTDVGRTRNHNEDSFLCDDVLGLYVVADGMGGHAAGEVASAEAIDQIHGMVKRGFAAVTALRKDPSDDTRGQARRLIEAAVQAATYMVFGIAEQDPAHRGMGTTITALLVTDRFAYVASVGDSRVYLVRDDVTVQLTEDHTLVNMQLKAGAITKEQAKTLPYSNLITRAVGVKDYVEVDTFEVECRHGDRFMLCSDGLHGYVDDPTEIAQTLSKVGLDEGAKRFIDLANNRGGKDNITVVMVETVDG